MNLLICIDDTDNLESIGSGELLEIMGIELEERRLGKAGFVTAHMLLNREDIQYTSHNNSVCAEWSIKGEDYELVVGFAVEFLEANSVKGSNPGLCMIKREDLTDDMVKRLAAYGKCAKTMILRKWEACKLAESMPDQIHLSEHGGTGEGIIGALAGCGLRLSGQGEITE
jgi:tRNA(Ile2) C34 agmatinyltransferase TiaS